MNGTFPETANAVGVELDLAQRGEFDPTVWCVDADFDTLGQDDSWEPPVPMYCSLIESVVVRSDDTLLEAGISPEEWDYYTIVELACLLFIRECWLAAGGERFSLHTTTQEHDSGWMLNLKTGEWESM